MTPTHTRVVSDAGEFAALGDRWDELVRRAPVPCAFLLHAWLMQRIRFYGTTRELAVIVAERAGRLVGGLPLAIHRRLGARSAELLPGDSVSHCDLLAADAAAAGAVIGALGKLPCDFVVLGGLVPDAFLAGASGLHYIERQRAPYVEIPDGWDEAYRSRFSGHRRREHARARRRLAERGDVEFATIRDADGIERVLLEAFALHATRFEDALDRSEFRRPQHRDFHLAKARALAAGGVARVATLRVDGELAAFGYFFVVGDVAWMYRCAFDRAHGPGQPGIQLLLHSLADASGEGVRRVELLGGEHAYKMPFASGSQPLLQGVGLATSPSGHAAVASLRAGVAARVALKRHEPLRRVYDGGRRMLRHLTV